MSEKALPVPAQPPADDGADVHVDPEAAEEGSDETSEGCSVPSFFTEAAEVAQLIKDIATAAPATFDTILPKSAVEDGKMNVAASLARLEQVFEKYLECPHLVGAHLEEIIEPLVAMLIARLPNAQDLVAPVSAGGAGGAAGTVESISYQLGQEYLEYDVDAPKTVLHHICRTLYTVVKVGSPKSCTSHFPHEVRHLENVFYCLQHWQCRAVLKREWEVRYCLLLWLSNLVLVPFALHTIDSSFAGEVALSQALLRVAMDFLKDTSKCREAAAHLIGRMMTRLDAEQHRQVFFATALTVFKTGDASNVQLAGFLQALANTFKLGKRRELLPHAPGLIDVLCDIAESRSKDTALCKTAVKVTQRLGLSLLRQKSAPWKYKKHVDVLLGDERLVKPVEAVEADNDEEITDGPQLEAVIGLLLNMTSHPDTIVRWSAAKGIGRLCERLPKEMADDVVDVVLDSFQVLENDSGWHGGMLAVAELCRRSILLPVRFDAVVSLITQGLLYDVSRGSYSVGSHVRDATCYVCWSVARAYDPVDLEPYVYRLSTSLVIAALFDREVNVRRAAAAALQESVGRLGNFPSGIELVTTMDFFSLSTIKNAYLVVAPQIAQHAAYRRALVDHLVGTKLLHWDRTVRRLAATSLGLVTAVEPALVAAAVLPELLEKRMQDPTIAARHGTIFALGECVAAHDLAVWSDSTIAKLAQIIPTLDGARQFRGRGGEFVRQACAFLLKTMGEKRMPLPEFVEVEKVGGKGKARTLGKLQQFLEETWRQLLEWLQQDAVDAFRAFGGAYFTAFSDAFHGKVVQAMMDGSGEVKAPTERRGNVLALGALPLPVLLAKMPSPPAPTAAAAAASQPVVAAATAESGSTVLARVIATLELATRPERNKEAQDAETRRNAVKALAEVAERAAAVLSPAQASSILQTFVAALDDYAVDKRGDVGSFVRTEAMQAIAAVVPCCGDRVDLFMLHQCVAALLQQSVEKIDRVRGVAGNSLTSLHARGISAEMLQVQASFTASPAGSTATAADAAGTSAEDAAAEKRALLRDFAVVRRVVATPVVNWAAPSETFPLLVRPLLLETRSFAPCILEGIVVSVGGMSIHVLKAALEAVLDAFRQASVEDRRFLSRLLVGLARAREHSDRLTVPLLLTVDRLITADLLDACVFVDVVPVLVAEMTHFSADIQKMLPLVGVLGTLCRSPDATARQQAWSQALRIIASRFPKVRAKMGTDLYTALVFVNDAADAGLQAAMQHLATTLWDDGNATKVRTARDALYEMLGVAKPGVGSSDMKEVAAFKQQKVATTYAHLVHEAGY